MNKIFSTCQLKIFKTLTLQAYRCNNLLHFLKISFKVSFLLRCLQQLSIKNVATRRCY